MKFFLDESLNLKVLAPLKAAYGAHSFLHSGSDLPKALDDVDIYPAAAGLGCAAYVCSDLKQVEHWDRRHERAGCRAAGLHWIGIRKIPVIGKHKVLASQLTPLAAALPYIVEEIESATSPQCFILAIGRVERKVLFERVMDL
ncbi:hypothetical protein NCCP2495_08500 [Dietzia sp. NCCP-2495]|uniref:hypothetical protein n=1 Tax=Dietzia sp. NCCP-2495 TaxID=2934675 RepID=UPI0022316BF4|nr:hypothetical protein [Dietzia sp. NCCP-2495]GLB62972.1 hypothetical protein NCCP2495_08500 [Dietzia sp. NCCP-2495]